jgi:hypothetical protein
MNSPLDAAILHAIARYSDEDTDALPSMPPDLELREQITIPAPCRRRQPVAAFAPHPPSLRVLAVGSNGRVALEHPDLLRAAYELSVR